MGKVKRKKYKTDKLKSGYSGILNALRAHKPKHRLSLGHGGAFLPGSQARAVWQSLLIISFGGDLQWVCPTENPGPKLQKPQENTFLPVVSLSSQACRPYPYFLSTSSGETPATTATHGVRSVPMASERSSYKSKIANGLHSQVCVWVLPRVRQ